MGTQFDKSRDVVNFDVKWLQDINEIALHVTHFSEDSGQSTEETRLLIPRALAIELRYALDRAITASAPAA